MGKSKKEKQQAYFFDNKALLALILPLVVEQLLAVLRYKMLAYQRGKNNL